MRAPSTALPARRRRCCVRWRHGRAHRVGPTQVRRQRRCDADDGAAGAHGDHRDDRAHRRARRDAPSSPTVRRRRRRPVDEQRRLAVPRARLGRPRRAVLRPPARLRPGRPSSCRAPSTITTLVARPARRDRPRRHRPRRRGGHRRRRRGDVRARQPGAARSDPPTPVESRRAGRRRRHLPRRRPRQRSCRSDIGSAACTRRPPGSYVAQRARRWPDAGCPATTTRRTRPRGSFELTVPDGVTAVANGGSSSSVPAATARRGSGSRPSRWRRTSSSC